MKNKNIVRSFPKIGVSPELKQDVLKSTSSEAQVVIHGTIYGNEPGLQVRIWDSIHLYPKGFIYPSELIYSENISFYPVWTPIPFGETLQFTLIFSGLPKGCKYFDLIESIPEPGGFVVRNIPREKSDVYNLIL